MFVLNTLGLSSPFDALYEKVALKVDASKNSNNKPLPLQIRSLLGRRVIVLKLEYLDATSGKILRNAEAWLFCKKYWMSEEWKVHLKFKVPDPHAVIVEEEEVIAYEHRIHIENLIDGQTVPSSNQAYLLRLSQNLYELPS